LEKERLVSNLQEDLQKERAIADRELTHHLTTVKSLEVALLQEKRDKKEYEERSQSELKKQQLANNAEVEDLRRSLKTIEKQSLEFQEKLSEAYAEVL